MIHSNAAGGQSLARATTATVLLSPTPIENGHAIVRLRAVAEPHFLIIVDGGASGSDLTSAVRMLAAMRQRFGDAPAQDIHGAVKSVAARAGQKPGREDEQNAIRLKNLSHAPSRLIQGVGRVHAMAMAIPSPATSTRSAKP